MYYAAFYVTAGFSVRQGALYQRSSVESCVASLSPRSCTHLYRFAVRTSVCVFSLLLSFKIQGGQKIAAFLNMCDLYMW